jgi:methylglutaconyl-CoA hydratase
VSDVRAERDGPVVTLTLDRPDRRNALDPNLLASLAEAFGDLSSDDSVRVVVLTGAGSAFSAGADLDWMRASRTLSRADNRAEAAAMADAFDAVDRCPKAVIARVNGPAIGGGAGLVACADVAVAVDGTRFAFAEVRLGLLPATIAPYVVRAIGPGHARELFTSGRPFEAEEARSLGLVHRVVAPDDLDAWVAISVSNFLACAPGAVAANKRLVRDLTASITLPDLPDRIAEARAGSEGQEGLAAFVEKREPRWLSSPGS